MSKLEIDSVHLTFGERSVLSDVYLYLEPGIITGLAGRNGSGKSSLLKILSGSMKASYQVIRYNNQYIKNTRRIAWLINYLPQNYHLPGYLTTTDCFDLYKIDEMARNKVTEISEINPSKRLDELSGGQRRLAEVTLCLFAPTKFSLLDEPFSHIAPVKVELICEQLLETKNEKAILITDHQYRTVTDISDRVFLCHNGAVRAIENLDDLKNSGYIPWK